MGTEKKDGAEDAQAGSRAASGSANPPEKITTLSELISARERRKAITCPSSPCFRGPIPAAFMANLSGEVLHRLMAYGMWVYTPNDKLRDAAT